MIPLEQECADLPVRRYEPGDLIISEGSPSGALYFLRSGKVRVSRSGEALTDISLPGSVFGEISTLLQRPHLSEVRAVEPSEFHVTENAEEFLKQHPNVSLAVTRSLARKVDTMSCYLVDLKQQYAGEIGHLGLIHEVLDTLMHTRR